MAIYNITSQQLKGAGILNSFEMSGVGSFSNVYSVAFDGTDTYIDLGASSTINNGGQFSFSFWLKGGPTGQNAGQDFIFSATNASKLNYHWCANLDDFIWRNVNNNPKILSEGVLDNNWHHILVIFNPNGADQTIRCFTDGANEVNVSTDFRYKQSSTTYTGALRYIGASGGLNRSFDGNLDEIAFWDDDQSANVSAIYNSGQVHDLNALSSPPINWYRMGDGDGGTGSTVTDQGTGGINGTLTNDAAFEEDVPS